MKKFGKVLAVLVFLAMFATALAVEETTTSAGAGQVSGAIFTTLEDGSRVNANIYKDKRDVYLDGGPGPNAPQEAAGLPDGNYYFQVTDPSGKTLLSEDTVECREFRVEDGVIVEFVSKTEGRTWERGKGKNKEIVPAWIDGWVNGQHDLGWDIDHDALTIQLMPYEDTPNRGGVYKVWATPTEHFTGDPTQRDSEGYSPGNFHGFIPRYSKTDNFKVKYKGKPQPTPEIEICKFEDTNGNGEWDHGEPAIPGWRIDVTDPLDVTNTYYTDDDGCVMIYAPEDGDYMIEEELPSGWSVTATIVDRANISPTHMVTITVDAKSEMYYSVKFGNFRCFEVQGYKYDDLNGDGDLDPCEPGIEGWKITLERSTDDGATWETFATTYTDSNGYYEFYVCCGGMFRVIEEDPDGWIITGEEYYTFTAESGVNQGMFNFLNFQCFYVNGHKYEDMNGNGIWDMGEPGLEGWTVTLYKWECGDWTEIAQATTDENGYYEFYLCEGGDYKVEEEEQCGWEATAPISFEFEGVSGQTQTVDFFNFRIGQICGTKWYDSDADGTMDAGEEEIEGIEIQLWKDGVLIAKVYTDADGEYCFTNLGAGSYEIKEVMPTDPGEYLAWGPTFPCGGVWTFDPLMSGTCKSDADFGNVVEYTAGHTWGYWKTHTGYDAPPRDEAYDLLPANPMPVDVMTPDGDYEVDDDWEAKWIFENAGAEEPPSGRGNGISLFRCQLLALHMNLLKYDGMGEMTYIYNGDPYSGWTVQEIYDFALDKLVNPPNGYDYHELLDAIDKINNNGNYGPGQHVLIDPNPYTP